MPVGARRRPPRCCHGPARARGPSGDVGMIASPWRESGSPWREWIAGSFAAGPGLRPYLGPNGALSRPYPGSNQAVKRCNTRMHLWCEPAHCGTGLRNPCNSLMRRQTVRPPSIEITRGDRLRPKADISSSDPDGQDWPKAEGQILGLGAAEADILPVRRTMEFDRFGRGPFPGGPVGGERLLDPGQRELLEHTDHPCRGRQIPAIIDVHYDPLIGPLAGGDRAQRGEVARLAEADSRLSVRSSRRELVR